MSAIMMSAIAGSSCVAAHGMTATPRGARPHKVQLGRSWAGAVAGRALSARGVRNGSVAGGRNAVLSVQSVAGGVKADAAKAEGVTAQNGVKYGVRLVGTGSAVPKHVLTNSDLEKLVETNDEWITTRTGITQRHVMGPDESITQLGADAANKALEMAGVDASEIDLIILCTSTPDDLFGSACTIQAAIGAKNAAAFDLTAACSGFVMGLVNATHMMRGGNFRNVLVIGADALSRYVDWRDRSTCILFGDGCGAMVLSAVEGNCNMLGFDIRSDGVKNENLVASFFTNGLEEGATTNKATSESAASTMGSYQNICMTGSEIFKFAVRAVPQIVGSALKSAGLEVEHIDHLVLHQANQRIIDSASDRLGVPKERVVSNIAKYGNTSAASIPLALDEAVRSGAVKEGDVVAMAGFGAGLTWGSAICTWGKAASSE